MTIDEIQAFLTDNGYTWHVHDKGRIQVTEKLTNEIQEFRNWSKLGTFLDAAIQQRDASLHRGRFKVLEGGKAD